jgi:hypothetical protein
LAAAGTFIINPERVRLQQSFDPGLCRPTSCGLNNDNDGDLWWADDTLNPDPDDQLLSDPLPF